MSLVWNWEPGGKEIKLVADYDGHNGRGSIYRTDSILKAIGKGAIFRSHIAANRIPYIVVGNCPPPKGYFDKIDGSVQAGIIQKFLSLNSEPLVIDSTNSKDRNPKNTEHKGFLRIDSISELANIVARYLTEEQVFIGRMMKKEELGRLIKSLNFKNTYTEIGQEFFEKIHKVRI